MERGVRKTISHESNEREKLPKDEPVRKRKNKDLVTKKGNSGTRARPIRMRERTFVNRQPFGTNQA